MKIRHISIKNFRGIKNLNWALNSNDNLVCLIGHGDSTKSTILKAIEYVYTQKWDLPIVDSDFYNCNPFDPIEIQITVGELSDSLKTEFVSNYRYYNNGNFSNIAEKSSDDVQVITVGLRIEDDLSPFWFICDSDGGIDEDDKLNISDRKQFNLFRLDKESKNTFNWKYDSPLLRYLEKDKRKEIQKELVELGRFARSGFDEDKLPDEIKTQAKEIEIIAKGLAVGHDSFKPNVDIFSADTICLHRGNIPMYMLGAGSQKITALAIAQYLVQKSKEDEFDGGFIIFDEIENSLEPHRMRHITSSFNKNSKDSKFQTILTTHSPMVVQELGANGLYVVRNLEGEISVHRISNDCIKAIRGRTESLFAKKIIICEGKTEFGLLKSFAKYWSEESNHSFPPQHLGVDLLDGAGNEMINYLIQFHQMGYEVCLFKDNDVSTSLLTTEAQNLGVNIYEYPNGFNSEKIIFHEASIGLKHKLMEYYNSNKIESEPDLEIKSRYSEVEIDHISERFHNAKRADTSDRKGIFRNIDTATELGNLITSEWDSFEDNSGFKTTLKGIEEWIYGN